jgi:hypothetical protein
MLAVAIALALAGTAMATMPSGIAVTTFVRAPLAGNKPNSGLAASADHVRLHTKGATDVAMQTITSPPGGVRVGIVIPASCWWRFSRPR